MRSRLPQPTRRRHPWLKTGAIALLAGTILAIAPTLVQPAVAQMIPIFDLFPRPRDEFLPSPLELTEADPLLPEFPLKRELTEAEKTALRPELAKLEAAGNAQLLAGDKLAGAALWNRSVRLSRFLGRLEEVRALGRAGTAAWQAKDVPQVRVLVVRLEEIHGEQWSIATGQPVPPPEQRVPGQPFQLPPDKAIPDRPLWEAIAVAARQTRAIRPAIALYTPLLAEARQAKNAEDIERYLSALAQLHAARLDDLAAVEAETELLAIARDKLRRGVVPVPPVLDPLGQVADAEIPPARVNEIFYLRSLALHFDRAGRSQQALAVREDLLATYRAVQLPRPIPALQVAIAQTLERLGRTDDAIRRYAEAATVARTLNQWNVARVALDRLGEVYRQHPVYSRQPDLAIATYLTALQVSRQAADGFGMMEAYDRLGDLFVAAGDVPRARLALEQGAAIAAQLQHREGDFARKLAQLPQASPVQALPVQP